MTTIPLLQHLLYHVIITVRYTIIYIRFIFLLFRSKVVTLIRVECHVDCLNLSKIFTVLWLLDNLFDIVTRDEQMHVLWKFWKNADPAISVWDCTVRKIRYSFTSEWDKGMDCGKSPSGFKKMKKKQVKDELDRIKQAEKKKRRLEKALATSAAIISELEKKKQREKEEQRRLDEEGAAIAEAVALQVLIGEDSNDACSQINYGKQVYRKPSEELGWVMNAHGGSICRWNGYGRGENGSFVRGVEGPYVDEMSAAGLVAARAVSNLQIADDEDINAFVFKRMFNYLYMNLKTRCNICSSFSKRLHWMVIVGSLRGTSANTFVDGKGAKKLHCLVKDI
ncbi:hypothetical protein M8C21_020312 [Ambrosia artemisiifolia]|uniref:Uncharacterized protein n=1 Tax=Ambrosia artemisiifolia TaxID=4212 RepID=A0AAD5C737_AMBAR|nr:hypothetical protein M8C21_020312 [Ambrosia artemisiifolia]